MTTAAPETRKCLFGASTSFQPPPRPRDLATPAAPVSRKVAQDSTGLDLEPCWLDIRTKRRVPAHPSAHVHPSASISEAIPPTRPSCPSSLFFSKTIAKFLRARHPSACSLHRFFFSRNITQHRFATTVFQRTPTAYRWFLSVPVDWAATHRHPKIFIQPKEKFLFLFFLRISNDRCPNPALSEPSARHHGRIQPTEAHPHQGNRQVYCF